MSFLDNLKHLFGLGSTPGERVPVSQPTPQTPVPTTGMPPTPQLRESLFKFIVEKMAPYTNEAEGLPTGLRLWLLSEGPDEDDRLAVALYAAQPGRFRNELSRHLANHYIKLAPDWTFSWQVVHDRLPESCTYRQGGIGLEVVRPVALNQPLRARVKALIGQTEEESYLLDPAVKTTYCVGRGRMVETASGRVRTNDIAFLDAGDPGFDPQRGEVNLTVSRQHASIRYDAEHRRYRLLADAGGLPSNGNKTKILRADDTVERADLPGVGYILASGDQIELGGDAKLLIEFVTP